MIEPELKGPWALALGSSAQSRSDLAVEPGDLGTGDYFTVQGTTWQTLPITIAPPPAAQLERLESQMWVYVTL